MSQIPTGYLQKDFANTINLFHTWPEILTVCIAFLPTILASYTFFDTLCLILAFGLTIKILCVF